MTILLPNRLPLAPNAAGLDSGFILKSLWDTFHSASKKVIF